MTEKVKYRWKKGNRYLKLPDYMKLPEKQKKK
jgi:hypothetical protein